jgi:periplasmic divalent cation tolerance protein
VGQAAEAVLVLKTRAALVEAATARIKALHSYACPCVVALPVEGGNPDYLDWLRRETASFWAAITSCLQKEARLSPLPKL